MSSGKGEVVRILEGINYVYISLSDMVREEVSRAKKEITRSDMQNIGNRLRELKGPGILGKRVREKIESSNHNKWVIDGIRHPSEIDELKKIEDFYLLGLSSRINAIINRIKKRKRNTDIADESELKKRLDREWGIGEPEHGQQVGKCMERVDFLINNNLSLEDLRSNVYNILKIIGEKNGI